MERDGKEGTEPDKAGSAMYRFAIPAALFAFATFLRSLQFQRVFLEGHVRFSDPRARDLPRHDRAQERRHRV